MIAITGTPGCGKTTLARQLRKQGRSVADLKQHAMDVGAVVGHDEQDGSDVLDLDVLRRAPPAADFVEGHLAHELPVQAIWVIRCEPSILRGRLEARGYGPGKVVENLEAEAMDLILQEALAAGVPVVQRDGSRRNPDELLSSFVETEPAGLKSHDLEPVDWSPWLLGDHGT